MSESASPLRISRLRVKNFRSIAEIDIPLGPLTVLIGANGSGKSNVVDALRFVRDVFTRGGYDQAVLDREGMDVIRRWAPGGEEGGEVAIEVTIQDEKGEASYGFALTTRNTEFVVPQESLRINSDDLPEITVEKRAPQRLILINGVPLGESRWVSVGAVSAEDIDGFLGGPVSLMNYAVLALPDNEQPQPDTRRPARPSLIYHLAGAIVDTSSQSLFYTLNPADLRQPQRSLLETPLDEHGRNLAAVLRRMLRTDGEALEELRTVLRRAVAGFDDLTVETVGGYLAPKLLYKTESGETRASYLGQESDGTIRMLGILAALLQEPAQPVVAIEEPEANIHPGALGVLAETFLEASKRGQVILTTHSPDLMTHLPAECFLIVEKVDGETRVGPLNTEQAEIVRQHLFSAGELMRMQGLHRQDSAAS